jgi:sugar-specific transcriptional regulator TrmB
MQQISTTLDGLGLTKNETQILLALYTLGKSTVADLARQSKMPRTTIYTALSKLQDKEIIMRAKVGKRELWEAVPPKRLLAIKKEQVEKLRDLVPTLEELANIPEIADKSTIVQYKGVRGLQRVYDMILDLSKGERVYGFEGGRSTEHKTKKLPKEYSLDWQRKVKQNGIILEVAVSEKLLDLVQVPNTDVQEAVFGRATITYVLPEEVMNFNSDILVFRNNVAIITPNNLTAVIINDFAASIAFKQLIKTACMMGRKVDLNALIREVQDKA